MWDPERVSPLSSEHYREKLGPALWVWAMCVLLGGGLGLALVPRGALTGLVVAVLATAILAGLLSSTTPEVAIRDGEFVAGKAHVPLELTGTVRVLDAAAMRHENGPGLDARAFLCIRGWIPTGVRVELDDPADPTPYWLVSSRHPQRLADAVDQARREHLPRTGS